MKDFGTAAEESNHDVLTEKQRRVLDLLIENKTSKEIGRALGISPYTVDQRISLARGKLGVSSRTELAARYRLMRKMRGRSPSDASTGSEWEPLKAVPEGDAYASVNVNPDVNLTNQRARQSGDRDLAASANPAREGNFFPTDTVIDHRVGPEVFEGISGTLWRIGTIVATALLLVMTILGLFAIFDQLNDLLA